MLRRVIDGVALAVFAWFLVVRLDAGEVALGLALGAVIAFTGWRIYRLWRRYRTLIAELAAARELQLSDDPAEQLRAERLLRSRRMIQAADMSLWTGFVMGAAATDYATMPPASGEMAGYDGFGGGDGGGVTGGDFGGGGFDGGM